MTQHDGQALFASVPAPMWIIASLFVVVAVLGMHGLDSRVAVRWHHVAAVGSSQHHAAGPVAVRAQRHKLHVAVARGRCCLVPLVASEAVDPDAAMPGPRAALGPPSMAVIGRDGPPP